MDHKTYFLMFQMSESAAQDKLMCHVDILEV